MKIEIMDTTLRDGEQTPGLAFTPIEKMNIAKLLLEEACVDRIEAGSARVSSGELLAVRDITKWCKARGLLEKVEILGFVDGTKSVDWIISSGARVMNLLCKGSLNHVTKQLKKTPEAHFSDIRSVVSYARSNGIKVNIYLEDWSGGMVHSPGYVSGFMDALKNEPVERFMLPDTLGILDPLRTYELCKLMVDGYPGLRFDYHAHNDYDIATANTFMAVKAGVSGVHTTVNGLGERAGNATLSSVVSILKDHLAGIEIKVNEASLNKTSKVVEVFSGIRVPSNKPIVGEDVFTQTCGVHADGDSKGNLYFNRLVPERFGRSRRYALGKMSGKASIAKNLEELGIYLDRESLSMVTERIVELGDKKESITTEDLPYIISDVLGSGGSDDKVRLISYNICHTHNLSPYAAIKIEVGGVLYEEASAGSGQYDAFMKSLEKIYARLEKPLPHLTDYVVTIPPGGRTNALVETVITWKGDREFKTRGLDSDQTASAIKATMKMLNLI